MGSRSIMLVEASVPDHPPQITGDPDLGHRIDAVHQRLQLFLAETFPTVDPVILIAALGYELVRRIRLLERVWTPKALDRFLVDFTRVVRRHVLERE
jgi:hypothetical protein